MKLYHFTNRNNLEIILHERKLKAGKYLGRDGVEHGLVSLTSDADPVGHGLTDGREISREECGRLRYGSERDGKYYCVDNTEFCISFSMSQEAVIRASDIHDHAALASLEVAGYLPCSPTPASSDLNNISKRFEAGELKGKSPTWWYHRGDLSLPEFEILHKKGDGTYAPLQVGVNGLIDLASIPAVEIYEYSWK